MEKDRNRYFLPCKITSQKVSHEKRLSTFREISTASQPAGLTRMLHLIRASAVSTSSKIKMLTHLQTLEKLDFNCTD